MSGHFSIRAVAMAACLVVGAMQHAAPLFAQPVGVDDGRDGGRWQRLAADAKAYVTSPLRAETDEWARFGGVLAAVGAAYQYDDEVRAHFVPGTGATQAAPDTHDVRDAAPAALAFGGTWLAARLRDDDAGLREAGMMLQSAAFGSATAYLLKQAAGRARPYESGDSGDWRSRGEAFPSIHTTAAFAIGTVLAEAGDGRRRWMRRVLGYGIAFGTAYQRMNHDMHWFSDTVAGAALGIATARFVMQRRGEANGRSLSVLPMADGLALRYTVRLRP